MIKKGKIYWVLALSLVLTMCTGLVFAASITEDLHVNIQTTYANGSIETGTFDFTFIVSTTAACDAPVYTDGPNSIATDVRGIISYNIPDVTLDYDQQYWLCYYRDAVLKSSTKITRSPYAFTTAYVNASGVLNNSNLNLTNYNISASTGFMNLAWSYLTSVPNLIRGIWNAQNPAGLLIVTNGTYIGYNQTVLNATIDDRVSLSTESDPYWQDNFTKYNDSWTTTNTEIWGIIWNQTFALIDEPLWTDNFTKYNASWSSGTDYFAGGIYIYKNGTNYFILNESRLNITINSRATIFNDSIASWVDGKNYLNWSQATNGTLATGDEPLWTDNFTTYNTSWGEGISWTEAIEEEKEEYLKEHPEEKEEKPEPEQEEEKDEKEDEELSAPKDDEDELQDQHEEKEESKDEVLDIF
ncbi:hypothetical protein ACFLZJ_01865 [Nanoarchaeota archaeon]